MGNLFAELKRRHIYRVAAAYAVVAWVLLQLFNNLEPILKLPEWAGTLVLVFLVGGFPITLLIAWMRELAPADGSIARVTTSKLDYVLAGGLAIVIALVSYQQLAPTSGTRPAQQASVATGAANPAGISIAVLPFVNLSSDKEQEFFSDGMTEEIAGVLAKIPDLHLVARSSAFEFKGRDKEARAVGQALGATHLIEGSVRKAGNRVRISAQLVRADNGLQLWTESYNRELTDIFATQEDIAQAIAGALKVPLGLKQGDTLVRDRTKDLESYQQYLHARALLRSRAIDDAIGILEPLVARDPNYAPAWALLARVYVLVPQYEDVAIYYSGSSEEARRVLKSSHDKVEMAARKAIQLDSRQANAYAALGIIQSEDRKWADAEDLYRQALALDPGDPDVLYPYSQTLWFAGRLKDSLGVKQKLRTLEPFVPIWNTRLASVMRVTGQNAAAIPILQAIPSDGPTGTQRNEVLAAAYAAERRFAEAADTLLLITGNRMSRKTVEDAARLLRAAPAKAVGPFPDLGDLDFVYPYVGAPNHVLDAAERWMEIGASFAVVPVWEPIYAPERKTERFKTMVRKMGLVDYWRARGWPDLCRPMGADDFVCD